jgi:hypothetical protein
MARVARAMAMATKRVMARKTVMASDYNNHDNDNNSNNDNDHNNNSIKDNDDDDDIDNDNKDNNNDNSNDDGGNDNDLFEMVWTIMPSLFLGSTFGIANNDNTKDYRAEEERGWA